MIHVGARLLIKIMCPFCEDAISMGQDPDSAFYIVICSNPDCDAHTSTVLVERATNIVVSVMGQYGVTYKDDKPERLYPALYTKDGKKIWPE